MPLSPCCPYHPAEVACRLGQPATCHAAFAPKKGARPSDLSFVSRPPVGLLSLRPGDSLTILTMALSVGFIRFVILRGYDPSRVGGGARDRPRAGLRPPLELHVRFSRMQLWRRLNDAEMQEKELNRSAAQARTHRTA